MHRRDPCVNGHGRRISCAFRRMLMRLMVPSRGRNDAGSRLVRLVVSAMRPERLRLSTRRTKPLRGGPKATPVVASVTPRRGLSPLPDSPRLALPAPRPHSPAPCPAAAPRSWRRRTDFPSARPIEKGAGHDAAAPSHDRGPDPPQPVPQDDPTLHQVGRRFRPVLPHLARTPRARARPLLPAPPDPGATGLLERPQAGPPRPPVPLPRHPGQGVGRRKGRLPQGAQEAPRRPQPGRDGPLPRRACRTPSTARCS